MRQLSEGLGFCGPPPPAVSLLTAAMLSSVAIDEESAFSANQSFFYHRYLEALKFAQVQQDRTNLSSSSADFTVSHS